MINTAPYPCGCGICGYRYRYDKIYPGVTHVTPYLQPKLKLYGLYQALLLYLIGVQNLVIGVNAQYQRHAFESRYHSQCYAK